MINKRHPGQLPTTAQEQFDKCVRIVKGSWNQSEKYRKSVGIKGDWPGTAIIIQRMIFGNIQSNK